MNAIVWKELRENLVWGALALAAFAIVLVAGLRTTGNHNYYSFLDGPGLSSSAIQTNVAMFAAFWGIALGLLQSLPEMARDRRAFLMHRPLSGTVIFFSKVAAGLILYFAVLALPFIGAAVWVAWPGNVAAPFDWRLTLAGWGSILCAVPFYFAGLLTGLRPARWYGSRGLPLAAAVVPALLAYPVREFWHALLVAAVGTLIFGVAAWGSFLTGGTFAAQFRTAKVALSVVFFLGMLVCGGVLASCVAIFAVTRDPFVSYYQELALKTGEFVRLKYSRNGYEPQTAVDLYGKPVTLPKSTTNWQNETVQPISVGLFSSPMQRDYTTYRSFGRYFIEDSTAYNMIDGSMYPLRENWYFSILERRWLGYASETFEYTGSIGPAGFMPPPRSAKPFDDVCRPIPGFYRQMKTLLVCPDGIYMLDAKRRTARRAVALSASETVAGAGMKLDNMVENAPEQTLAAIDGTMRLYDAKGHELRRVPLRSDADSFASISLYDIPGTPHTYVAYNYRNYGKTGAKQQEPDVVEHFVSGKLEAATEVPSIAAQMFAEARKQGSDRNAIGEYLGVSIAPPVFFLWPVVFPQWRDSGFMDDGTTNWYAILGIVAASVVVCTGWTAWMSSRYAFSNGATTVWAIVAALTGVSGAVVFWAIHDWPARETCPGCGRRRVVTRERCEHCAAEFAAPVRDGAEIIEVG